MTRNDDWLLPLLDMDGPFKEGPFDIDNARLPDLKSTRKCGKPKIDLRMYLSAKGFKYTCPLCGFEFCTRDVREWWRKPGNRYGGEPIPFCNRCHTAGGIPGWVTEQEGMTLIQWRKKKIEDDKREACRKPVGDNEIDLHGDEEYDFSECEIEESPFFGK